MTRRCLIVALSAIVWFIPLAGPLRTQVNTGTISGSVKDDSHAIIQAAKVTVVNPETQVSRVVEVNGQGFFSVPDLTPGTYSISAFAPGFKTVRESGLTLRVGGAVVVDLTLPVGELNDQVTVTAPADVETASSSLDFGVNSTTMRELPLNGRDWTSLALLQPGVGTVFQPPLAISNNRGNRGLGAQFSIGGNRPQQNNYRLDGITINDYSNGAPGSILGVMLGVEAVQEFSVVTNNAPANYGRTGGGVMNAITRSGANGFHGSAYEFLRNSDLDARNFFDGATIPNFRRNQFGADAGGPIRRNRTFIFGDYEGVRQALGTTKVITVPSAAARSGQVTTGRVAVDPKIAPYLSLYPLPNGPVSGDVGIFTLATSTITREDFLTTRVDHTISTRDRLFGTYMFDDGRTTSPDSFNNVLLATLSRRQAVILEENRLFGPAVGNSLRLGFSRVASEAPKNLGAINPVAADTHLGFIPGSSVGLISVTGLTNFPGGVDAVGEYDFHYNSFQWYDDVFFTRGTHVMKLGAAVERVQGNELGKLNPAGQFTFGSLAAFLTNRPSSFNAPIDAGITPRGIRQTIGGAYFLDDWRVKSNLTVNLGVRYEAASVPTETQGKLSTLLSLYSTTPHLGSPYFSNPTKRNIEPRVGFAWDPFRTGKTSIRGGFGVFDNLPLPYLFELLSLLTAPYLVAGNVANLPAGSFPSGGLPLLTATTLRNAYIEQHPPRSYVLQWNFNVQRQIMRGATLMVGYVGVRGVHLPIYFNDVNTVLPAATPKGWLWPSPAGTGTLLNPAVGQIAATVWPGNSAYHALQTQFTRRLQNGLQFGASYTFAKSIDTGSSALANDTFSNTTQELLFDLKGSRGLSDFNIKHNFTLHYVWELPGANSPWHVIMGGWQLGGLLRASTGMPFTPLIGGDPLGMLNNGPFDRPDLVAGCGSPVNAGNPQHYINARCFSFPNPVTRMGNAGRNILSGPGLLNLDTSLCKNIPITERVHLQFRAELFNVLNHANFTIPASSTVFAANGSPISTVGLITSTATSSRQVQFALKLLW